MRSFSVIFLGILASFSILRAPAGAQENKKNVGMQGMPGMDNGQMKGMQMGGDSLITMHEPLSAAYFERIGRWKDAAGESKWKPNVAMVAYRIWMQAASEQPRCPGESQVADFLQDWSERKYVDKFATREVQKQFGLSRATTLLYFISGQRFPIFDSRVRRAMRRLLNSSIPKDVPWYLDSFHPLFREIAALCDSKNVRTVDQALFSYGDRSFEFAD